MAKNFIQPGNVIDVTAGANLTSGTAVLIGTLLAVPITDIATGETGAAQIEGVWELPKLSTAVFAAGDKLTWDTSAGEFISGAGTSGDCVGCAVAVEAAGNGATTVAAKLVPGSGALTA